jgi:hypothetical protein
MVDSNPEARVQSQPRALEDFKLTVREGKTASVAQPDELSRITALLGQ